MLLACCYAYAQSIGPVNIQAGFTSVYAEWQDGRGDYYVVGLYGPTGSALRSDTVNTKFVLLAGLDTNTHYSLTVQPWLDTNSGAAATVAFMTGKLRCAEYDTALEARTTYAVGRQVTDTCTELPFSQQSNYSYTVIRLAASEIQAQRGEVFTGVEFNYAFSRPMLQATNCSIYMAHTIIPTGSIGNYAPYDSLKLVYAGALNAQSSGWNHWNFNRDGFSYDGSSDLELVVVDNSGASDGLSFLFACSIASRSMSFRHHNDSLPYSPSVIRRLSSYDQDVDFSTSRPLVRLTSSPCSRLASCVPPLIVDTLVTSSEASLIWAPGYAENAWNLECRHQDSLQWDTLLTASSSLSYLLSSLSPNSDYEVRLSPLCNDSNVSSSITIHTQCSDITLPWQENFDAYSAANNAPFVPCWHRLLDVNNHFSAIRVANTYAHSGSNSLYLANSTEYCCAVLPRTISSADSIMVSFWYYSAMYNDKFLVGVMDDPHDTSTFTHLYSVLPTRGVWEYVEIVLSDYSGTGRYLAFMVPNGRSCHAYIDDLRLDHLSQCLWPSAPEFPLLMPDSCIVSWQRRGSEASWTLEYATAPFGRAGCYPSLLQITDTFCSIGQLLPQTTYYVRLYANCGADTTRHVYGSFRTPCAAVRPPLAQNFDVYGFSSANPCWYALSSASTPQQSPSPAHSRPYSLALSSSASTYTFLATPYIDAPIDSLTISFWLYRPDASSAHAIEVGVLSDPNDVNSFACVETVTTNSLMEWEYVEVPFSLYSGSGHHLALLSPNGVACNAYIDDITIDFSPDCFAPYNLRSTVVSSDSCTLSWKGRGSPVRWVVEYAPQSFTPGSGAASVVYCYDTVCTLSGLQPGQTYHVCVRADCQGGDTSRYAFSTFAMPCVPVLPPIVQDFDTWTAGGSSRQVPIGSCYYRASNVSNLPGPYVVTTQHHSGANSLYMYSSLNNYGYFVLPPVAVPVSSLELSFFIVVPRTVYSDTLDVGVMDDPADIGSFTRVYTVTNTGSAWQQVSVPLASYRGTGRYVALLSRTRGNSNFYIDDMKLDYPAPCLAPTNLRTITLAHASCSLAWTPHCSPLRWVVEYAPQSFTPGSGAATVVYCYDTLCTLSGLQPNQTYHVCVRADCQGGDTSRYALATFTTPCAPVAPPIVQNFDTWAVGSSAQISIGTCYYRAAGTTNMVGPYVVTTQHHSGANSLYMYSSLNNYGYFVLPPVAVPVSSLELSFFIVVPRTVYSDTLDVGVMDDPADIGSFTRVYTVTNTGSAWQQVSVPLASYRGTGRYVALLSRTRGNSNFYIDDMKLDYPAPCLAPTNLRTITLAHASCSLAWTPHCSPLRWVVEYAPQSFTPGSGAATVVYCYDTLCTLSGLQPNQTYHVCVRADCQSGDTSQYALATFTTPCAPVPPPIVQNFDTWAVGSSAQTPIASCYYRTSNVPNMVGPYVVSNQHYNGANSLYFYSTINHYSYFVLPQVTVPVSSLELSFYIIRPDIAYSDTLEVGVMDDPADIGSFTRVYTVTNIGSAWQQVSVPLASYRGSGRYVALLSRTYNTSILYVDDLNLDYPDPCPAPTNMRPITVTYDSCTLAWTPRCSPLRWVVEYAPHRFTPGSGDASVVYCYDTLCTLSGLQHDQTYHACVRADCQDGDTSRYAFSTFDMPCVPVAPPIVQNFDAWPAGSSTDPAPIGTCYYRAAGTTDMVGPFVVSYLHYSGANSLYMYSSLNNYGYFVLPPVAVPVSSLELSFFIVVPRTVYSDTLDVGVMDDPADIGSFTRVYTVTNTGSAWQQVSVPLASYRGTGRYVALLSRTRGNSNFYIDDMKLDYPAPCLAPTNLRTITLAHASCSLAWTPHCSPLRWVVEYAPQSFTPGSGAATVVYCYDTLCTLSGLQPEQTYLVYVYADCQNLTSGASYLSFTTDNAAGSDGLSVIQPLKALSVYPNPTDGTLHIESPDGGLEGGVVSLMSTQGRYESVPLRWRSGTHIVADLSHLAAGIYYLQVATPTKVYTEKVVRVR